MTKWTSLPWLNMILGKQKKKNCYFQEKKKRAHSWQGKWARRSLQSCDDPELCEKRLSALLQSHLKNKKHSNVLNGLLRILSSLKVSNDLIFDEENTPNQYRGFLSFQEAYEIFCGYQDIHTDIDNFRDNLLHPVHGLCVDLLSLPYANEKYIVLRSKYFDFSKLLEHIESNKSSNFQPEMDSGTIQTILHCIWIQNGMQLVPKCFSPVEKLLLR